LIDSSATGCLRKKLCIRNPGGTHAQKQCFCIACVFGNRPGAGGNIAGEIVAKSTPDGHTLIIANNSVLAANATLYKKMTFSPSKELTPVVCVASQLNILVVPFFTRVFGQGIDRLPQGAQIKGGTVNGKRKFLFQTGSGRLWQH